MNTRHFFDPVLRSLATVPPRARSYSRQSADGMLGWMGLSRSQSRIGSNSLLVAVGALAGAAAALLLAPETGRNLRTRLGKSAGGSVGSLVGRLTGRQLGAHPVATTRKLNEAREMFTNH